MTTERIVPIEEEPRHFLRFQNRHVRLFDVHLPPGYRGLYHSHVHDGVFVNVEASETVATDFGGERVIRGPRQLGETYFFNYAKAPKVHRVDNTGETPFRVVDTEIHAGCGRSGPFEDDGRPLILENDRVRVTRLLLEPGRTARRSTGSGPHIDRTAPGKPPASSSSLETTQEPSTWSASARRTASRRRRSSSPGTA